MCSPHCADTRTRRPTHTRGTLGEFLAVGQRELDVGNNPSEQILAISSSACLRSRDFTVTSCFIYQPVITALPSELW